MLENNLASRIIEFERNIWDHTKDPFQLKFDAPRIISKEIYDELILLGNYMIENSDDDIVIKISEGIHRKGIEYFEILLQFAGLTRSKIRTDIQSIAQNLEIPLKIPSSYKNFPKSSTAWPLASKYLLMKLKPTLIALNCNNPNTVINAINNATWPGWIRQERAKRSGHEAEGRLARILYEIGIPFEPKEKVSNPLCRDVQIFGESFDIIVPNSHNPCICVKATVHTSNIGQYGESKDHLEMETAKKILDRNYSPEERPILLALIDGIGFNSNRAGLEGVLIKSDEFCQFSTIWKPIIIANYILNLTFDFQLYLPNDMRKKFTNFLNKYNFPKDNLLHSRPSPDMKQVVAGKGIFIVNEERNIRKQQTLNL